MQDDNKGSAAPLDPNATPASHDHLNGPGMTNGIPDQLGEGDAKARPTDDRQGAETVPAKDGAGS
jgi:hypothetical protein